MVERRPTPKDTPDGTRQNSVIHYAGLAVVTIVVIGLIVLIINR